MGFFKNIGASYEYLYDFMSFDSALANDIDLYEPDPGIVVEKNIIKEKSGFCIRIRREKQKRARTLRFSYIDIIRLIEAETPYLKNEKISRIVFTCAYIYNTPGYRGKSILMRVDFGDEIARWENSSTSKITASVYQHTRQYFFGHNINFLI